jgi:hypothetical protein
MDEEVSFTVPHDGIYVVFVFDYSGSGSYSLGVEITAPSGGGIPGFPLEAILLGLVLTGFALTVLKKRTNVIR